MWGASPLHFTPSILYTRVVSPHPPSPQQDQRDIATCTLPHPPLSPCLCLKLVKCRNSGASSSKQSSLSMRKSSYHILSIMPCPNIYFIAQLPCSTDVMAFKSLEWPRLYWDGFQCGACGAEFRTRAELNQHQVNYIVLVKGTVLREF